MNIRYAGLRLVPIFLSFFLIGCQHDKPELVLSTKSPVALRAIQARAYETSDTEKIYRAIISMLQDHGYTIMKVEPSAGTVTADKFSILGITATVYKRNKRTIVRANALIKLGARAMTKNQVDSAEFYQKRFFEPLSKAVFLQALQVEDPLPDEAKEKANGKTQDPEDK